MYRRPSKKRLLIQRIIVSVISVISIIVIATGTILFILGYRLDSEKGRLEQGALIQFDSVPNAADVSINGNRINGRTPAKQSVIAGTHSFIVSKNGYKPWAKSLTVKAGTLTWLDYIRLVPEKLTNETVATFPTMVGEKASPDLKKILVQEKADDPTFQLVDISAAEVKVAPLSLPLSVVSDATMEGVAHTFRLGSWDQGSRYMLVRHDFSDRVEWIVLDTQNVAASVNVSRLLSINPTSLKFAGTSGNTLYALLDDGTLRKLDLGAATVSRALITNVRSFSLYETNLISYVGIDPSDDQQQVAGVYRDGDETAHVLKRVASLTTPVSIDITRYYNDTYVAIAEGVDVTILAGSYPTSSSANTSSLKKADEFTTELPVTFLSFSEKGKYLVAQSGTTFVGYEVEHERQTKATIESTNESPRLRWLDEAYVWVDDGDKLVIREFDGTNTHTIGSVKSGFDVTLSQNGRFIYSVNKDDDMYVLQRVKMILD